MTKVKIIIFDVDGVLVDSRDANIAIFQSAFEKLGLSKPSRKDILACLHLDLMSTLTRLTKSTDSSVIDDLSDLIMSRKMRRSDLFIFPDKLRETLIKLHKTYILAIVTNRYKDDLNEVLDTAEIRPFFDLLVPRGSYKKAKPNPEGLLRVLDILQIDASSAVYVGDTYVDIEAAHAAGLKSINLGPTRLSDADLNIASFTDIPLAISKLK